jgi:photosystem II stability/assembly factor-like uncharacterized protein
VSISSDNGVTFTNVTIAAGEYIMSFAASKTLGTFYAVTRNSTTSVSKLYVSTDSGATWTAVAVDSSVTSYTNVNADPYNEQILTLSGDNDLWLSTNAGSTWTKMGVSPARSCGNFSLWTSTRWYACAGYSTDNGTTWTDMDTHTNVMRGPGKTVVVNPADVNVLYGDCMSGVCKSIDGGLTWRNSLDGITGVNVLAISQTRDKGTVWISSSNGLGKSTNFTSANPTWTWPVLPCDPLSRCDSSGIGEAVWVKPDNADIVLAGSIGGWVYLSTNGGTTWTGQIPTVVDLAKFKTGSWNNLRPQHFISDPTDPTIVYLAMVDPISHLGAVLKSTDTGVTWTDMAITSDAPATRLAMTNTGILYAGTGEGRLTTTTKGVFKYESGAWTQLTGIDSRLNITGLMVDPEVQTTVYAAASNDLAPLQEDGFYKSTDAGVTWKKIIPTGYTRFGAITVQRSTSPNTLYMPAVDSLGHGVLLKSSDSGETWGMLYQGLKSETYTSVLFDGLVLGGMRGLNAVKSRAKMSDLKSTASIAVKGKLRTIRGVLQDATTKKILKNKTIGIYRQAGKNWKLAGVIKTNTKGAFTANVRPTKTTKYRLTWTPSKSDRAEYTSSTSRTYTFYVNKK